MKDEREHIEFLRQHISKLVKIINSYEEMIAQLTGKIIPKCKCKLGERCSDCP